MMSQFLGLDTDRYVTKSPMSLLFKVSTCQVESIESGQSYCIKFDEFLGESIHSQLMNLHNTRFSIFQSYLVKMFLFFKKENLQFPKLVLMDEMSNSFSKYMIF